MKYFLLSILFLPHFLFAQEEPALDHRQGDAYHQKMEWFKDAKLGIFIHWGLYAVDGISESWSFYNGYISHDDYMKQADGFTTANYDPKAWAELIKSSGAKYSVITTKHHDGFALWDTKFGDNNVTNSPAKKDVLTPFVSALRENDLKVGLYYSLIDWTHSDYPNHTKLNKRYIADDDPERWYRFQEYNFGQMAELRNRYKPDLWWFDGDWEHSAEEWRADEIRGLLLEEKPSTIINSRLRGRGDYATPENGPPVFKPHHDYWELCLTTNDNWGYVPNDLNYKSPQQVIDIFVDCISKGGNLLLDIGPKADGTIPVEQVNILTELGTWTGKHEEAIYGIEAGVSYEHFHGPSTLSPDSTTLYLYVRDIPKDGKIALKGINNKINRTYVVGSGQTLNHQVYCKPYWSSYPGLVYIDVPEAVLDDYNTVIAVMLDGKIDLYRDFHEAVKNN